MTTRCSLERIFLSTSTSTNSLEWSFKVFWSLASFKTPASKQLTYFSIYLRNRTFLLSVVNEMSFIWLSLMWIRLGRVVGSRRAHVQLLWFRNSIKNQLPVDCLRDITKHRLPLITLTRWVPAEWSSSGSHNETYLLWKYLRHAFVRKRLKEVFQELCNNQK